MIHLVTLDAPPQRTGGIASWIQDTALALQAQGAKVCLHAPETEGAKGWDAVQPFTVRRMWGRSWGRHQGRWVRLQIPRSIEPGDAVIYSTWRLAEHAAAKVQVPQAITVHGSDLSAVGADGHRFVATCGQVQSVLTVSAYLKGLAKDLGVRASVVPMPLAPAPLRGAFGAELLVVARLTQLKGVDRVIRLAQALGRPLRVLGDGPQAGALKTLGQGVVFEGRVSRERVFQAMNQAAATLLLSKAGPGGAGAEGLGLVLLEAQARGCPVISSGTGGLAEATEKGLILADSDTPNLDRVRSFLGDLGAGERARKWVRARHSPNLCAQVLLEALS